MLVLYAKSIMVGTYRITTDYTTVHHLTQLLDKYN